MMGTVITASTFWKRIGTKAERKKDRRIVAWFAMGIWKYRWRKAEAAGDHATMDDLDREYEMIKSL